MKFRKIYKFEILKNNMEDVVKEIINELGEVSRRWGFQKSPGLIWGFLYFEGQATQEKIAKELKLSSSQVSQALNLLLNIGLISVSKKEKRKNVYKAELSLKKIKRKILENSLHFGIEPMINLLNAKQREAKSKDTGSKIKNLKNFYSKLALLYKAVLKVFPI